MAEHPALTPNFGGVHPPRRLLRYSPPLSDIPPRADPGTATGSAGRRGQRSARRRRRSPDRPGAVASGQCSTGQPPSVL
ncbi:hypothetical protein RHRU231_750039 [Rhodococcus ruber]|uniref:Uncharacterized protein n=1 Tax=Rhodococcus ruber TaxID=1830 RepID=A0A098BR46_9NOCA|nr:hypothetical protein RHRU231_750039 [Rhodococcus ruber]